MTVQVGLATVLVLVVLVVLVLVVLVLVVLVLVVLVLVVLVLVVVVVAAKAPDSSRAATGKRVNFILNEGRDVRSDLKNQEVVQTGYSFLADGATGWREAVETVRGILVHSRSHLYLEVLCPGGWENNPGTGPWRSRKMSCELSLALDICHLEQLGQGRARDNTRETMPSGTSLRRKHGIGGGFSHSSCKCQK